MNIIFIGAGNLATNLAKALYAKGHCIRQVYSRTLVSAQQLAACVSACSITSLQAVEKNADLYIISLKDTAFIELLSQIVQGKQQSLMVHTAGSIPMNVFEGHLCHYGVLYPMQTFSKQREVSFQKIPFFVEAKESDDLALLKKLAATLSDRVYEVSSEQRSYLHLSAVFACNFANHMYSLTDHLLKKYQLPFEVMLPLIDETAHKVHQMSPLKAQTGPAVRYDENVISKHLEMLADEPQLQELYEKISKSVNKLQMDSQND